MRRLKFFLILTVLILSATSITSTIATSTTPSVQIQATPADAIPAYSVTTKGILTKPTVELGQKIKLDLKVTVDESSPLPLNGFMVEAVIVDPDSKTYNPTTKLDKVVKPGHSYSFGFLTNVTANKVGEWYAEAYVKTLDGTYLDGDSSYFDVVKETPKAYIEITDISGYAATAIAILVGLGIARMLKV